GQRRRRTSVTQPSRESTPRSANRKQDDRSGIPRDGMRERTSEETGMHLLLTNDDGFDAPGLRALLAAVEGAGDITVLAPAECHSGCGHRVTTDAPVHVRAVERNRHVIAGTPADCVRLGLDALAVDATYILSGINAGGNLGADVYH